jgi:malonate transporter
MNIQILLSAVIPVILILGLGFAAGKHHSFTADQTRGFSRLALQYALPATLFLGMAHFDRKLLLREVPIATVMLIGYSVFFLGSYWILRAMRMDKLKAALFSYAVSSTAVPIYGLTVLVPIYGEEVGTGIVGLAALVTNLTQVAVAIFLLQAAVAKPGSSPSVWATIGHAAMNPLVWSPVLGAIFALLGLRLSPLVSAGLKPLAVSAAGVAIFASGLTLAAYPMKLTSRAVIVGTLVCIVLKPAVFFLMIKGAHLSGVMANATFVSSSMPASTPSVLFAQQYGAYEAEMAGTMLLTTVGMLVILPTSIALCAYL